MAALAVGVLAPGPENVLSAGFLRDGQAVVLARRDENKGVFGKGKVDRFGLLPDVAHAFGIGHLPQRVRQKVRRQKWF